ncbi:hypothetical protein GSI_03269 [Ganoderma sinense ZZ0214-1]|uniref:Uncharacterized protein n=1 Tax=Ganoderma sinense ZZ0214-1 TaxID=1077348 RepID=A0A2G8SL47_9APHY|nr:hypothetical protein GSI_03269 [Ganoderma sinense ZZ0214-1]
MDLAGRPWILTHVLGQVIIPSGYFHIFMDYYGTLDEDRDLSIDPLELILPRQLIFRSLLPHCTVLALVINGGFTVVSAFDQSESCSLSLKMLDELFFNAPGAPTLTEAIWMSLLDAFSPSPLSHFCLEYPSPQNVTTHMWTALFGRFSDLDYVEARFSGSMPERGTVSLLENLFAALRDPAAHRIRTLELVFLALTSETIGAIMDLLCDRASMGAPLERLVFVVCFCESSLDVAALKTKLESSVNLTIWYDEDTDTAADEFRTYDTMSGPSGNAWWRV